MDDQTTSPVVPDGSQALPPPLPTREISPDASPSANRGTLTGHRLDGYLLEELLGVGGMAEVYRAYDVGLQREVAIKVIADALAGDDEYVARFRGEARRVAALSNPHIVPVYQAGEADVDGRRIVYLVMPLLRESLRERLRREGPLPYEEAVRLTLEVAAGLESAHAAGLVHRDVKPGNILLNVEDHALLADFGIARATDPSARMGTVPTWNNMTVGTPEYMAPEQLRGTQIDQRADVYSLGAVLYELLTGRLPFDGDTPFELAARALHDPVAPPSFLVADPAFPAALDTVVLTALARDPRERYSSVGAFTNALRQALAQHEGAQLAPFAALGVPRSAARQVGYPASVGASAGAGGARSARRLLLIATLVALLAGAGGTLAILHQLGGASAAGSGLPGVIIDMQATATANASRATGTTGGASSTPGATTPTTGTPLPGPPVATGSPGSPSTPVVSPTATSAPAAALTIAPESLVLTSDKGPHCSATQTVTNTTASSVGWSWEPPPIPGYMFQIDGKPAGPWPSATTMIPAGGSSTLVVSGDCKHGHSSSAVTAKDTLGHKYALELSY